MTSSLPIRSDLPQAAPLRFAPFWLEHHLAAESGVSVHARAGMRSVQRANARCISISQHANQDHNRSRDPLPGGA